MSWLSSIPLFAIIVIPSLSLFRPSQPLHPVLSVHFSYRILRIITHISCTAASSPPMADVLPQAHSHFRANVRTLPESSMYTRIVGGTPDEVSLRARACTIAVSSSLNQRPSIPMQRQMPTNWGLSMSTACRIESYGLHVESIMIHWLRRPNLSFPSS
jgi:hypothetical protein